MCVLLIGWQCRADLPLVVGANRDESYARPAAPPELLRTPAVTALAPRDLLAGGTWEGVTDRGLVVVITNRRDVELDPALPSRGRLVRAALNLRDAGEVREMVESETRTRRYNGFNLFYADRERAFVSSWTGSLATRALSPGTLALSNERGPGELRLASLDRVDWGADPARLRETLLDLLRSHAPHEPDDCRVCKHGDGYGTVSSSLFFVDRDGNAVLEYAAGPACRAEFARYELPRAAHSPAGRGARPRP